MEFCVSFRMAAIFLLTNLKKSNIKEKKNVFRVYTKKQGMC